MRHIRLIFAATLFTVLFTGLKMVVYSQITAKDVREIYVENRQTVHVFAVWKVKEGQLENVLKLLNSVRRESVKEKGNLFYTIHQGKSDANTIILFEGYTDEDAVEAHRKSAYFQEIVIGKIIPLLEKREVILAAPFDNLSKF